MASPRPAAARSLFRRRAGWTRTTGVPNTPADDLARWVPRLLATWRAARKGPPRRGPRPPPDALLPEELREVGAAVARLSRGLTRDRELAGARYMDEERLLGAYLLFYWPVSYLQARGVLSELPRRPRAVLDLGSGPGPMAFAALDAGAAEVTAADRSARALAAARELARHAGEPLATREWNPARAGLAALAGGRRFDLVSMGHVLNELWKGQDEDRRRAGLLEEALALVAPGGSLLVIEPALRDTSRALLRVRDLLVERGAAVRAPCLFRGPCPALLRETDWCHAERPVDPPPLVAQIAKAAGLRREAVKMSYLVVAPPGEAWQAPPAGKVFRIVSEPLPSKGRLRYMGCGPEGRMGLSLQEKHVRPENRAFERLLRGDVVEVTGAEPRGDGLALGEASTVKVLAPAGRPVPPPRGER
ncbi:Methyltransferase type 12 [Anaeromyxobacter dehalogenans 2CP-1]|uniref:Methyltransferase type 12 n=1 Tax=Anaeromyxobacter dehalogenans (strain ATCC BAA-258 / DSM 21875 / 2CP-1) TaxID=455488 RepID=B8JAX8_ANAD2|nr:Methyltransferase type 12 [Anaeromyxobacter dehalogenans 2CP-1]